MDADVRGELERLRARAYGPDADLAEDPVALSRLAELEDLERRRHARSVDATSPDTGGATAAVGAEADIIDAAEATAADPTAAEAMNDTDVAENGEGGGRRRPIVGRARTLWLWAGSLAAVAAVTSAASIAATTFVPVARTAGVAQVDTLRSDPTVNTDAVRSLGFDSSQVAGYVDFYGLTAYTGATEIDSAGNRADCLLIVETADIPGLGDASTFRGGFRFGACGAGAFPATVEFVVTPELPEVFRQRFPVGSSVQFVRDGERVGVFSDAD